MAADVSDLEHGRIAHALLDLQIEVIEVWRSEILADGIGAQALGIARRCAIRIGTSCAWSEDGCAAELRLSGAIEAPVVTAPADGGNAVRPKCISLYPL